MEMHHGDLFQDTVHELITHESACPGSNLKFTKFQNHEDVRHVDVI